MSKTIISRKNYILFKKEEEVNTMSSAIIITPDVLNPNLIYGKVTSVGNEITDISEGDFIYASKAHATEINAITDKIYSVKDEFVVAIVKNEK